jgi:hypothetical protein
MNIIYRSHMRKIILALTAFILLAIMLVSCKSSERCAAYGERQRYQIERH